MDIVSTVTVRQAVEDTLKLWLPWTLAQVLLAHDLPADHIAAPAANAYHELHDEEALRSLDPRAPVIATVVPDEEYSATYVGDDDELAQDGRFSGMVNVVSAGTGPDDTISTNDLYRTAIRVVLDQQRHLGGLADDLVVTGASYRPVGGDDAGRFILSGIVAFDATVRCINPRSTGLTTDTPPDPPYVAPADAPTVLTTSSPVAPMEE